MRYLIAIPFVALVSVTGTAGAQQCDVFTDVLASDSFCPAVQWLRNRQVTSGCAASNYCPADNVTRAQMALFMNRLGVALSPDILDNYAAPGAITLKSAAPFGVYCATADSVFNYGPLFDRRSAAIVNATFSALADNPVAWRGWVVYSTDSGTTWTQVPGTNEQRASAAGSEWSNVRNNVTMVIPSTAAPGLRYRFGIAVGRDDVVTGTTGNFSDSRCQIVATMNNQNGASPPY